MADDFELFESSKSGLRSRVHETNDFAPLDRDRNVLAKSGKKQVLKRRFGLLSITSFALTNMICWEFVLLTFGIGLQNGGPAGLIYGCIIAWFGMMSVYMCLAELSSMMPTAAGQYHWSAALAPRAWKALVSYISGWITIVTWIVATTAGPFQSALMMQQLINWLHPSYEPQPYQATLISWAVIGCCVLVNTVFGALLPGIELTFLIIHVIGFFAFLIPILYLGPRGDVSEIFTTFNNSGDWSSYALAFFVGFQGMAGLYTGGDCAVHMSEEVQKADISVPRAMTIAMALNGALSLVITVVMLYVAGPLDQLLQASTEVQFPFMNILYTATGNVGATTVLMSLLIFLAFAASCSGLAAASRITWSFARDRGLPFSRYIAIVERGKAIPMVSIGLVAVCVCGLCCIQIGSTVAFEIIISLIVEGYYCSYLMVVVFLLYRRVTGGICDPDTNDHVDAPLTWGPWRIKGMFGIANNIFAICYLVLGAFFSFWPPTREVNAQDMNYSSVVLGGVAILSAVYYFIWARKSFRGPIVETVPGVDATHLQGK